MVNLLFTVISVICSMTSLFLLSLQVFGVDFGTTTEVKIKNLRFLHKKFAKDPIQALRGCLDCIRPANGIWVWETIEYFVETALEIPLNGTVTAVNDEVSLNHIFVRYIFFITKYVLGENRLFKVE